MNKSIFPSNKAVTFTLGTNGAEIVAGDRTSMTTIGHVFIPLDREHDGVVPTGEDRAHFESLPVPLALWQSFEECLSDHLSELSEGQIDRDEKFWFEAAHVNAMIGVVVGGSRRGRARTA
jgi:hypothetical protein